MSNDSDDNEIPLAVLLKQGTRIPLSQEDFSHVSSDIYLQEYKWPKSNSGQFKILYQSLIIYLHLHPNDTRLNDLKKWELSESEIEYLLNDRKFKSIHIDKNSRSVLLEDVCDLMVEQFPEKFKEYLCTSHHCEIVKLVLHQEKQRTQTTQVKTSIKRAIKFTSEYNSQLNAKRKDERCAYFDLQTQIIHHPQKKKSAPDKTYCVSKYPVAILPGQFQDYFKRYSSDELQNFPLNTVLNTIDLKTLICSNQNEINRATSSGKPLKDDVSLQKVDEIKDNYCGICMKGEEENKNGIPEKLINCSQCSNGGHPSCLDMNKSLLKVIKGYPWQCMECKVCTECLAPHDEHEMMFCDNCDRGYHSYCVGVKEIPKGRWVCNRCGKCCSCLSRQPVSDGGSGRWKMEFTKPTDGSEPEFLQNHCRKCSILFRKGSFCPVCLKVYCDDDGVVNPMVCCDNCDRWIHTDCDGIDEQRYIELSKDHHSAYTCVLCRGEKEERMDSFHKKRRIYGIKSADEK
ncbi:PHD finger protein 10 isoform X2 [Hydra vulgaris]|uniref:PHD finger protein 10 n=1 Tax=Hydra vulgaris TaxID=6087 RepID=A0ABM4C0I6_HYDVU